MAVVALYYIEWTEFERGWGQRPDGKSYYATKETAMEAYDKVYEARKNHTGPAPDCYSSPSKPKLVEAQEDILREVNKNGVAWRH